MTLSLNIIYIGILLMTFYIADSASRPYDESDESITNVKEHDKGEVGYLKYLRQGLMDATHVIDNLIEKSKRTLMDLPHEDWVRNS